MKEPSLYKTLAHKLGICIIIPTYNNAATLEKVVSGVLNYCNDVIVVNDGSTDNSKSILSKFDTLQHIDYNQNKGKGWALRNGFEYAFSKGYRYAITIDSDGQHFPQDLPVFIEYIEKNPDRLLIGARNMGQENVPGKSSFGNKFSNFWFWLFTGFKGPDTQSGYRLYPLRKMGNMKFATRKFEFEIEVLVRSAWKGITIDWVPVTVYYPPPGERISHFRPFKDFTRISILNTILFFVAFLYIKPRDFIKGIFNKKKRRSFIDKYIVGAGESEEVKALSIAFGIFMGIVPIWGFQLIVAIPTAIFLKLNKALVILAANISIPPMIPIILFASHKMGGFWMGDKAIPLPFSKDISFETISQSITQYVVGSVTLAILAGVIIGLISYLLLKLSKNKSSLAV
jgi:glycosyltransferase involved in cell wall biosynthesis